jgi:hypothetical protein
MKNVFIILCGFLLTIAIVGGMLSLKISNQSPKQPQKTKDSTPVDIQVEPPKPSSPTPSETPSKQFPPQPTDPKPEQATPTPPQSIPAGGNQNRGNYDEMIDAYRI